MELPAGLILGAVPEREVHTDLFLSERYPSLDALPRGAVLGTSSLRRQAQVLDLRCDLRVAMLRGNVETRLRKMREGQYDAIILASAGIKRLGLSASYQEELGPPRFLSAVGQGALGVEMRADCQDVRDMTAFLNDRPTRLCVMAERGLLAGLDGGCQVPIGGHATLDGDTLSLVGMVAGTRRQRGVASPGSGNRDGRCGRRRPGPRFGGRIAGGGRPSILEKLYAG